MKKLFVIALFIFATTSVKAATVSVDSDIAKLAQSKGKILAITGRGSNAVDTAHLLAIQKILHPAYQPVLMVVENSEMGAVESEYHLSTTDLPVFIFVNPQGKEIGRIAGGPLTAVGRYVANNSAILDQ